MEREENRRGGEGEREGREGENFSPLNFSCVRPCVSLLLATLQTFKLPLQLDD